MAHAAINPHLTLASATLRKIEQITNFTECTEGGWIHPSCIDRARYRCARSDEDYIVELNTTGTSVKHAESNNKNQ